jgi:hypothetical protein
MRDHLVITIILAFVALVAGAAPASADPAEDDVLLRRQVLRESWRDASPAERRRIRQLALEHWAATPAEERQRIRADHEADRQQRRASRETVRRDLAESTTPAERREIRRYLEGLSQTERHALRTRVESYRTLDRRDRERLRGALREFRRLPPEKQERFRANARRWKEMSPGEKTRLREKMTALRGMEPGERLELLERTLPDSPAATPHHVED